MTKKIIAIAIGLALLAALVLGHVNTQAQTTDKNIVEIAQEDGNFTSLVAALTAAGLVDDLSGPGPFTVFAPTDAAFAKLDPCLLQQLLTCDTDTLTQILLYHVAAGEVMSSDLTNCQQIQTLQCGDVTVTIHCDAVCINDAKVIIADIQASNGVIHVIDTVLIPPG
jgi:uncharacterized surface protein with fasciclin (FAS1) repeats